MRIASGVTDQYVYFVAVDATDFTTRETALTGFTVYRSRNNGTATAMTTPTVAELSASNMPGVYSLLLDEDMTIDAGDDTQEMAFHITQADMAPVTRTIELYRPKITAGDTLATTSGAVDTVTTTTTATTATNVTTVNGLAANVITAASINASALDGKGDWNVGKTGYTLTATTGLGNQTANITGNITGNLTGSIGSLGATAKTDVNTEVDTALTDIHLDHLFATAYDATAKPGAADALLNEMVVDDAGETQFTVNALENGPSGSGASAAAIADAVWDEDIVAAHGTADTAGLIVSQLTHRALATSWTADITANSALDQIADDGTASYDRTTDSLQAISDAGGGGPTAAQIADAVWDEDLEVGHAVADSAAVKVKAVQTDLDNGTDGLGAIKTAVDAVPTSNPTAAAIADAVWDEDLEVSHAVADSAAVKVKAIEADTNELQVDDYPTTIAALQTDLDTLTAGVTLAAGAITDASLAGNMEIVFETDFATNYNATRNAWATNLQDTVGTGNLTADVIAINGDSTAAANLEASLEVNVTGSVSAGTHTAALIEASDVTGHGDDTFIGRVLLFRTGTDVQYEAGVITDYVSSTGRFDFAASTFTTGATDGDTFVIV